MTVSNAMQDLKYLGFGTRRVPLRDGEFISLEMRHPLQVEHPVTEMKSRYDLFWSQIRIAAGGDLPMTQDQVQIISPAIELPFTRKTRRPSALAQILQYHPRRPRVSIDSAVYQAIHPALLRLSRSKLIVPSILRGECPDALLRRSTRWWSTASRPRCRCSVALVPQLHHRSGAITSLLEHISPASRQLSASQVPGHWPM